MLQHIKRHFRVPTYLSNKNQLELKSIEVNIVEIGLVYNDGYVTLRHVTIFLQLSKQTDDIKGC